ncbi:hypothetical protein F4818DRAFT_445344 [Hypoxylon cercidicola]|nr:hypothetical protein F4818DRAFT_445344 [Hypoxylon cercidicola]
MFMNPMPPRPVWVGPQPDDNGYTSESHFIKPEEGICWQPLCYCPFFNDYEYQLAASLCSGNGIVSQQLPPWTMDEQQWFQPIAADSGDEGFKTEDLYSDCVPRAGASTPYGRVQTAAAGVSAVNPGRDFGPNHPQHNKELAGNDQMFLPNIPTANAYPRGFGTSYDPRQHPWQTYNTTGDYQTANYLDYPDGLGGGGWPLNQQVLGEPWEGPHVSPSSFSSSAPSSATSEAMAMTLDRATAHASTSSNYRVNSSVSAMDTSGNAWGSTCPSTISPKVLQIRPSPTPTSSSESIRTKVLTNGDPDFGSPAPKHHHARSPLSPPQRSKPKSRKELPSKPAKSRQASTSSTRDKSPIPPQQPASPHTPPHKSRVAQLKREDQDDTPQAAEGSSAPSRGPKLAEGRAAKDEFLVKSKLAGMTYKEIRRKGNFTEAESTLRGRFRTLTKDKEARVRKPEWQDNDIRLLRKAVRKLNKSGDMSPAKAPWGQVATYIADHGGSYQFGSATCHRKWKELVEEGMA